MAEFNYDATTIMKGNYPVIKKLGACSPNGEMTPFVWNDRLYRMESVDPCNGLDLAPAHAIIRDVETGAVLSALAHNSYFYSAYEENGTVYVLAVDKKQRCNINLYESRDLIHWDERVLLSRPGWKYYNTALTKGPDGYVLGLESDHPDYAGVPFTIFFAKSTDLQNWEHLDPTVYCHSRERYNGGPWMKYSEGWYYLISVTELPCLRFTSYIFRTKNFEDWYVGIYNPILMPSAEDRTISPDHAADLTPETREMILQGGFNINNSDIDMCDWNGKTYINYFTGNQLGTCSWMMEAEWDGTVAQFLKACFDE